MAMLAEPKRKQKWTLNPRGKEWSDDSNKFGQKMLEKMGWTSGKGLGANEQGVTEHVKVSYKNDQSGIGFKDKGDQWTRHQVDFNDLLSQLQEQNSNSEAAGTEKKTEEKEESLELKSKRSRARVHYHKFTRGKDVKKYSAKDLANIFGKKDLKDSVVVSKVEETIEEVTPEPKGARDNRGGVLTVKGGNMDEYFKNKFSNFVQNGNSNQADEFEEEYEPRVGFGFGSSSKKNEGKINHTNSEFAFANEALDLDYPEKASAPETNRVGFAYDNPCLSPEKQRDVVGKSKVPSSGEGFINPALNLNDSTNDDNNGAEFEVSRVEFGLDNNALDLSDENGKRKRVTFNERVEYNTDVVKKKKRKGKGKGKLDKFEVDNSKLKKRPKEIVTPMEFVSNNEVEGFVNEALDIEAITDEVNDNELNERKTKRSKRKKNRRLSSLETIEETAEEISQIDESEIGEAFLLDEPSPKKSKQSKKSPAIEMNSQSHPEVSEVEVEASEPKKKHKKDKKIVVLEEPVLEKKSAKKKEMAKKSEEMEITVLTEISRKISKNKKNKIANEPESYDLQEEAIEPTKPKKKDKKRSKSKDIVEIMPVRTNEEPDIPRSGAATKRKSSSAENGVKLGKRSKLDNQLAMEDEENVEQNRKVSSNPMPLTPHDKKDKRSRKTFKSLFVKVPTLYFSGSNINEIAGYGATITNIK